MTRRRMVNYGLTLLLLILGVVWFFTLRPQLLGGPVAYVLVSGTSMEPTYQDGDLIMMRKAAAYESGDIVSFTVPSGKPGAGANIIHRIVGEDADGYITRGDGADGEDIWRPTVDDIAGEDWVRVPGVGGYLTTIRTPVVFASIAAAFVIYMVLSSGSGTAKKDKAPAPVRATEPVRPALLRSARLANPVRLPDVGLSGRIAGLTALWRGPAFAMQRLLIVAAIVALALTLLGVRSR